MRKNLHYHVSHSGIVLHFNIVKFFIGCFLAAFSYMLCCFANASTEAKLMLPIMFLVVAGIEVRFAPPKITHVLVLLWSVGIIFVTVYASQLMLNESTFSLGIQRIVLNMAICSSVMCVFYLITAKRRFSVIAGTTVLMLFTAVNYFVFKFRGSELCPADFLSLKAASAVVKRYEFSIDAPFAYAVILAVAFIFAGFSIRNVKIFPKAKSRLHVGIFILLLLFGVYFGSRNVTATHFLQSGSVSNGYFLNFVLQIEENNVQKPSGYEITKIQKLEDQFFSNKNESNDDSLPVIIAIMNESFVDFSVLGNTVQTNIDILPYFNALSGNTIRGYALSSVIGGGTPNSEYEFLSGNSMGFLPNGSIVYQQFLDDAPYTILSYLKDLGYTTIATHPEDSKNWLRYSVYPSMGFDEMYFLDNYPQENKIRGLVSDQEMYEQIIHLYENHNEEAVFLFGITMQNHGFYSYAGDDFRQTVSLEGYSDEYPDVAQYLSLLHESDLALEFLISYFNEVDQDVVILFFGDHYPRLNETFYKEAFGKSFDSLSEQILQYIVPFVIWANYDIEEQYIELTSLNYLSTYLLQAAHLELPAYNQFISEVEKRIPAMNSFGFYSKAEGRFIEYDRALGEEAEILELYRILQYNCLFDDENRSKAFFPAASGN